MAKRTASQLYSYFTSAGFGAAQATIMTAIALAESGGDNAALGDVALQNNTWGPSYGYAQVRTLKSDTGKGTTRDISWLAQSDLNQARAAWEISRHGQDFSPWSVYTSSRYRQYLGQAQAAAAGGAVPVGDSTGPFKTFGPSWLPWNQAAGAANQALAGSRAIVVEGIFVVLGLGLVGAGLVRAVAPTFARNMTTGTKTALGAVL